MAPHTRPFSGCNMPHDPAVTAEGWEWRCNTDDLRAREVVDTYQELGFEVRLLPVNVEGLSESCMGCKDMLRGFRAVYVRKPSPNLPAGG